MTADSRSSVPETPATALSAEDAVKVLKSLRYALSPSVSNDAETLRVLGMMVERLASYVALVERDRDNALQELECVPGQIADASEAAFQNCYGAGRDSVQNA